MNSGMQSSRAAGLARGAVAAIGVTSMVGGAAAAVRADATIVSQATQSSGAAHTQTTYYKGHKIRIDPGGNGAVTIFDGDAGKLYILNPLQKTYFLLDPSSNPAGAMMAMFKVNVTATVKPTGATRKIAGQVTREYKFTANIDMSADPQMMSAMSGGAPAKGASAAPMHIGTVRIDGDEWVASIASLPGGGAGTIKASLQQMTTMMPGAKSLLEKLGTIPGVALAERQTATIEMMVGPGAGKKRETGSSSNATSVREGALADSLFTIPAGYKLQEGGMGMPPGARRPGMPAGATPPK